MGQDSGAGEISEVWSIEEQRRRNMRQLLLRASRIVNRHVVAGLHACGYESLRSTHTTLLSNIDLTGSTVTAAAERAGITKQAMGRLAAELEDAGYIGVESDPDDARARMLHLTDSGTRLMLDSLRVMRNLENDYGRLVGADRLVAILDGLEDFIARSAQSYDEPR